MILNASKIIDFDLGFNSEYNYKQYLIQNFFDKEYKYKFAVGDIEANHTQEKGFEFALGVMFDGKIFHSAFTIEDYFSLLKSSKIRKVYFHNLNFDFIFFLKSCFLGENVEVIQSGNMLLSVKVDGITFLNSLSILPMSLKKVVSIFLKINWSEWVNQKDNIFGLSENELLEYCKRDCLLTFMALFKLFNNVDDMYNVKNFLTIPSLALKVFNKKYVDVDVYDEIFCIKNRFSFFNEGYYFGGHTEKFINNIYEFKGLNYYDVNSLYPYIMGDVYISHGGFRMVKPSIEKLFELVEKEKIFYCEIIVDVDCEDIRIFPVTKFESNYYPLGKIKVKVSDISLKFLKDNNKLCNVIQVLNIVVPKVCGETQIFKEYVKDLYSKRKSDVENDVIYKLLLNSLYGKYGQKEDIETTIINATKRKDFSKFVNYKDLNFLYSYNDKMHHHSLKHARKDIAGRITEGARVYMSRLRNEIKSKGGVIYYQDTDSLIGDFDLDDMGLSHLQCNNTLGKLKKENKTLMNGFLIAQKLYWFGDDKKASKGVKNMYATDYKNLVLDIINKKVINGDIKIIKWVCVEPKNCLMHYPKSKFYNTRFTQLKTFLKKGFFGVQIVPHVITNLRERIDGESKEFKAKVLTDNLKQLKQENLLKRFKTPI
jgi:hypothetical protein